MSDSFPTVKAVSYARVSTLLGQNPELQHISIRQFAQARGFHLTKEYTDQGVSGAKERRPALDELVRDARHGRFKVLIVTGIDRLARNTLHLLKLIDELRTYNVAVISLRENLDFTTSIGQMTLTAIAAIAQLERELTRERIRSAMAAKKIAAEKSGVPWKCGRPNVVTECIEQKVIALREQGMSIRAIERHLNRAISRTSIERVLRAHRQGKRYVPGC